PRFPRTDRFGRHEVGEKKCRWAPKIYNFGNNKNRDSVADSSFRDGKQFSNLPSNLFPDLNQDFLFHDEMNHGECRSKPIQWLSEPGNYWLNSGGNPNFYPAEIKHLPHS